MVSQNTQDIVNSLGNAISERNRQKTVYSVIDFLMGYLPDSSKKSDIESTRRVLNSDFGLNKGTFIGVVKTRQAGIGALLDYFDGKDESNNAELKTYELSFLGGGPGYGKIVFDRRSNKVMLPCDSDVWPELHRRFVLAYGSDSVQLNIPNNRFYISENKHADKSENRLVR